MAGSPTLSVVLLILAGLALYGVGTLLVRSANRETPIEPQTKPDGRWTAAVTGTNDTFDRATRIDMIERLALVGEPWCIAAIAAAAESDLDAPVRYAAARALRALTR